MADPVVIVGAGQAASECAAQLRRHGFDGAITILGDEPSLPYQRPPLSKGFLAGAVTEDALLIRNAEAYARMDVTVRTGVRVDRINPRDRTVSCAGETIGYGRLVLAVGGYARRLRVPGADLGNIHYLRTIADVRLLQSAFQPGRRLTIVGGGYVGLEVAAVAISAGMKVRVLEGAPRVLARVTAPAMSAFYTRVHSAEGVEIHTDVLVNGFLPGPDGNTVGGVVCGEGAPHPADVVIVGIGLVPNTQLAEEAGLVVDGGILVDAASRTADPHIYAIGDCAVHAHHGFLQRRVRIESVPNAIEQGRAAAASIMDQALPEAAPPWFWSDQYELKLQMVGLSEGYDTVALRGSQEAASFSAFYLRDGQVIAADSVNRAAEFMMAKRLVAAHCRASATALSDESVALKSLLPGVAAAAG